MSNMEKPKNSTVQQDKNKTRQINTGTAARGCGGGGIGLGIIFLGGAVATAAFLFLKRQRKSNNAKNCNQDQSTASTEIPYKFIEDKYINKDKGLGFVVPNSPHTDMDQNLRYGTSNAGVHVTCGAVISDETTFLQDENDKLEANGRNEIPVPHGQDINVSDSSTQSDASALKEKEFPLPTVVGVKGLQPTIVENPPAMQKLDKGQVDNADGTALDEPGIAEDHQDVQVNTEGPKMDADCGGEENMGELHSKEAAETNKADQSILAIMQSREEQESRIYGDEGSTSIGNSLLKASEFVGEGSFRQLSGSSSLSDDVNIDNHSEESELAIKNAVAEEDEDEELEAAKEERDKIDNKSRIIEVDGSQCPEHFGTDEANENLNACCAYQGAEITTNLIFTEVEEKCNPHDCPLTIRIRENEALEATDEFQDEGNTVILMPEEGEKLQTCQVGLPISEAMEVAEEVKVHQQADGKEKTELLLVGEEKGAQNDAKTSGEQSQETREAVQLPDKNDSGRNHRMLQTETSSNGYQEDTSASDEPTCEGSQWEDSRANVPNVSLTLFNTPKTSKPEIRIDNTFKEVQQSVEASEIEKENVTSEPCSEGKFVENEDLPKQLAEKQAKQEFLDNECGRTMEEPEDAVQLRHESSVTTEKHKLMRSDEHPNDHKDETNLAEKVEESSEGTEDSSAESNAEPIWPAESIQDLAMELEKMDGDNSQQLKEELSFEEEADLYLKKVESRGITKNRLQMADDNRGSQNLTAFEKYMLQLGELIHLTTNSQKRRILTLTIIVLSVSLCIWYFDLLKDFSQNHPNYGDL